ncbi:UNKNOWN [Stylonychia lemnae]|uniref:Uncharacterized protein n=1 Tax=Stylonychia lemnae TaxID=5949 RepID=A0A078ANL0_STYLE|nr:UNKNOWN [Stylonychia lemnae]|eukprot:CDW82887.1 UNKNOWN [Stylonychia lemnae]
MEKQYNLSVIASDLKKTFTHDLAASTLLKCTQSCFLSLKEDTLLPTEERCLRNCFVKSANFNDYMENEMRYTLRNM